MTLDRHNLQRLHRHQVMRINKYQCSFFKRIRDTKGIFHAKMGTIQDRNAMGLTEAEDIKEG